MLRKSEKTYLTLEPSVGVMLVEEGGRGHKTKNIVKLQKLEKQGSRLSPEASRGNIALPLP